MTGKEALELNAIANDMGSIRDGHIIPGGHEKRYLLAYQTLPEWRDRIRALVDAYVDAPEGGG